MKNPHYQNMTFVIIASCLAIVACALLAVTNEQRTWASLLAVSLPIAFVIYLVYIRKKHRMATESLLQQVDDNVKKFLFNNGKSESTDTLSELDRNLKEATTFIRQIGQGNFEANYAGMNDELRSINQGNLSGELLQMKDRMIRVAEEEKQRSWVTAGLAHFSEILRIQNKTFEEIINKFISELVKYLDANQGGVFVANQDENGSIVMELKGCYAYGRRKYVAKRITPGEGLVGQCYLEGDVIYLTDVPKNYVAITSGLGEATPRCVILVPLKNHEEIEGVIEIASFKVWQKFESDFLVKIGEILGSAISNIKVNEQTKQLLGESQRYAEQLKVKEEEMRQSLEELNATQEAMQAKSAEAVAQNSKLNAVLDSTVDAIVTLDEEGRVETVNRSFGALFNLEERKVVGRKFDTLVSSRDPEKRASFLQTCFSEEARNRAHRIELCRGDGSFFEAEVAINSADLVNRAIFTCIIRDITERIKSEHDQQQYIEELRAQEEELKQNMEELEATQEEIHRQMVKINQINRELDARVLALNTSTIMSESDLHGTITYVNDKFSEVSQYTREELIGKPHNLLRHPDMPREVFAALWRNIKGGRVFRGIVKNRKKDGSHYWVDAVISPVLGEDGKPEKYIGVRYVIEDEELAQKLYNQQLLAFSPGLEPRAAA